MIGFSFTGAFEKHVFQTMGNTVVFLVVSTSRMDNKSTINKCGGWGFNMGNAQTVIEGVKLVGRTAHKIQNYLR
jgi:hypothetical protein